MRSSFTRTVSRAEILKVLQRAGYPPMVVAEIATQLPDPIDLGRDRDVLIRYGITTEALVSRLGGSP
jgi:hypothetical protein